MAEPRGTEGTFVLILYWTGLRDSVTLEEDEGFEVALSEGQVTSMAGAD